MNKSIAIVFSHAPHGTSFGREALDLILSISINSKKIGLFFLDDGVFQLINFQQPKYILLKNYISAFKILSLYNIHKIYYCLDSMISRGLNINIPLILKVKILNSVLFKKKILTFNHILKF